MSTDTLIPEDVLTAYFGSPDDVETITPLAHGNINDTWLVNASGIKTVLQCLNGDVFPEPDKVIENFRQVTEHVIARIGAEGIDFRCPRLITTTAGKSGFVDEHGGWWRGQSYVTEHISGEMVYVDKEFAAEIGTTLARFHLLTSDLNEERLHDPLPGFHVMSSYLADFARTCQRSLFGPNQELAGCLNFIHEWSDRAMMLETLTNEGFLKKRIIHGDPKLDNVIITEQSGAAGLMDLDTTGPGLLLHDIGDCLRSICNRQGEYPEYLADVEFDSDIFAAMLQAYSEKAGELLTEQDRKHIVDAAFSLTYEVGLRFFTDHLAGDRYFKVNSRGDNLIKSRVQFTLAQSILDQEERLKRVVEDL